MSAIVSWVTGITPPLASLTGKRARLFFLAFVSVGLVVAGFMHSAKTPPSPALLAERVEAGPALAHHAPEPATHQGSIALSRPLPPITAMPAPLPATQDPLLLEHGKKLAALDTAVSQVRADMGGMASRLDGFQAELHGIKQRLGRRPRIIAKATYTHHPARPSPGKARQYRQRARVKAQAESSPAASAPGLQVVALNKWGAESRLIVREKNSNQYRQLRLGDPLSNGTIVGMDARKVTIRDANGIATIDLGKGRP
jgi:hypothetical protein